MGLSVAHPTCKKNSRYIRCGFKSQYQFGVLGLPIILSKSVYISMPPATIAILIITNPYTSNLTLLSPPFERWKPTCKLHCPSHHNNKMHKNKTKSGLHLLLAPCQKFHIYLPGDSIWPFPPLVGGHQQPVISGHFHPKKGHQVGILHSTAPDSPPFLVVFSWPVSDLKTFCFFRQGATTVVALVQFSLQGSDCCKVPNLAVITAKTKHLPCDRSMGRTVYANWSMHGWFYYGKCR